jgi:hypothetical protein
MNISSQPIEVNEPFKFEKGIQDSCGIMVKRWTTDFRFSSREESDDTIYMDVINERNDTDLIVHVPKMKLYPNVTFDIDLVVKDIFSTDDDLQDYRGNFPLCEEVKNFVFTFRKYGTATADRMLVSFCILDKKKNNKVLAECHDMLHILEKDPEGTEWEIKYDKNPSDFLRLQLVIKLTSDPTLTAEVHEFCNPQKKKQIFPEYLFPSSSEGSEGSEFEVPKSQSEVSQSEGSQSEVSQSEGSQSEGSQSEGSQSDGSQSEGPQSEESKYKGTKRKRSSPSGESSAKKSKYVIKVTSDVKGNLNAMPWFGNDLFSDFNVVAADSTIFKCHKIILVGKSEFFSKYFKKNAKAKSIKINVESTIVKALLRFIYQGLVHQNEATVALLSAAKKYELPVLVDLCAKNITRNNPQKQKRKLPKDSIPSPSRYLKSLNTYMLSKRSNQSN